MQYLYTVVVFRLNLKTLKKIMKTDDFWPMDYVDSKVEKEQIKVYRFVNGFSFFLTSFGFVSLFLYYTIPILLSRRETPQLIYYIFDPNLSPFFEILYFLMFIGYSCVTYFVTGFEFFFYGLLAFTYCQMTMLNALIRNINIEKIRTKKDEEDCFKDIMKYVEYYSKILK